MNIKGTEMTALTLRRKLAILSDAAKYDASCASSGSEKRNSAGTGGIGSTEGSGICHSYAPDGRCISLLKILLTNFCVYDCIYCVNRSSSNVARARFSVEEVVRLTLDFYKRNYIEGLFLSSGIIRSPDYTMEELVRVARSRFARTTISPAISISRSFPMRRRNCWRRRGGGRTGFRPISRCRPISVSKRWRRRRSQAKSAPPWPVCAASSTRPSRTRRLEPSRPSLLPAGKSTQMIVGADARR
jgi:predicted DNA-binding helix-hairpin-helix protein